MSSVIKIASLPSYTSIGDNDIMIIENGTATYKVSASTILNYIKGTTDTNYVPISSKGIANGVVPLNTNTKIESSFLTFGETANTIYDGASGKTNATNLTNHIANVSNPHNVTKTQIGLDNVENKSATTILGQMTSSNVTTALGFTPEVDGTYERATSYTDTKISDLINGAPSTLDTLKEIADLMATDESAITALNNAIGTKADKTDFNAHIGNGVIHVTSLNKSNWDAAYGHSMSTHARIDATLTAASTINGDIKINDTDTVVYQHPLSGVSAGTYSSVTVDTNGHVTNASSPVLDVAHGGTGATTVNGILTNIGITATITELNALHGIISSTAELNYTDGVTSNIQTQLDGKAPTVHGNHVPDSSSTTTGFFLESNGTTDIWHQLTATDITTALGYMPGTGSNIVTAVKGNAETEYKTGNVNITPISIGLSNVDNTADIAKSVLSATKATKDASSNIITSTYAHSLSRSTGLLNLLAQDATVLNSISFIAEENSIIEPTDLSVGDYWIQTIG